MTTHIDRMITDVTVEPEPEPKSPGKESRWEEADRQARLLRRNQALELRTRAEGLDD
jgi:hypothetical protein